MRVKSYLAALCIPVLFAACSEEGLINNESSVSIEDREKFDLVLSAARPAISGNETRLGIDGDNQFYWEKDIDVVGAALTDATNYETVEDGVFFNYPFSATTTAKSSKFNGKSAVAKGIYFFHFPYVDHLDRGNLALNFPSDQTYVVPAKEGDLTSLQQAIKGMKLVSPLYQFGEGIAYADAADYEAEIDFYNMYTVVQVQINPTNIKDGVTAKVEKVTLSANVTEFMSTATSKATAFGDAIEVGADEEEDIATKAATFYTALLNQSVYTIGDRAPIVLDIDGDLALENGKACELYLLAPKGTYSDGLELNVHTSEGVYTREIAQEVKFGYDDPATENDDESDDIRRIKADMNFSLDGTGNVILPYTFDIARTEDWTNAVTFLENHAVAYINKLIEFNLTADVAINNLPVFNLTINGDKKLTLNSDYTISAENAEQFEASGVTLVMAAGKTLTLDATIPATGFNAIENLGTLNVSAPQVDKPITNLGTMNVSGVDLTGGITNKGTLNFNGTVTSGAIVNGVAADLPAQPAVLGTINMNAEASVTADITNNAGTITLVAGTAADKLTSWNTSATTNADAIIVNANATVSGSVVTNTGTITNKGIWAVDATNTDGDFIIEKGSVSNSSATIQEGNVEIKDINDFTAIAAEKVYTFNGATITTAVSTYEAYDNASNLGALTDITLTAGDWSYKASPTDADKAAKVITTTTKSLTLNGVNLTFFNAPASISYTLKGANTFNVGAVAPAEPFETTVPTSSLTIDEDASLTVGKLITVNSKDLSGENAVLNGNLTVNPGAKMYFETATVGAKATLTVKGNTDALEAGVFGVSTTFTNNYKVIAEQGTHATNKISGKVTQPTNVGDAIFQGNSTAWGDL